MPPGDLPPLIGESPPFLGMLDCVSRAAPLDRPVLVIGERGTGKELVATRLHFLSRRWDKPLIKLNCAALTEGLLESELFGHEAGAFTGAVRRHIGRFERAQGGSLFLDEIAACSPAVQEKLLRAVEYGAFERVGGSRTVESDVRVIAAANVDLPALADQGRFRADLLDRLAFDVITLPPLRARPDDIVVLSEYFAIGMTKQIGRPLFYGFSDHARAQLQAHPWPGNVRELKNAVERSIYRMLDPATTVPAILLDPFASPYRPAFSPPTAPPAHPVPNTPETSDHGPPSGGPPSGEPSSGEPSSRGPSSRGPMPPSGLSFEEQVRTFERRLLDDALRRHRFNRKHAAADLGLSYHQFRRLLAKHGFPTETETASP